MTDTHTPTIIERRDARQIRQITRDLCVSIETVPVGGGFLTVAPLSFLLQLRDAFGDEGMADVYAVIDGPALRALKVPAGIKSIDDEMRAIRDVEARRLNPVVKAPRQPAAPPAANERTRTPTNRAAAAVTADGLTPEEILAARQHLGMGIGEFAVALNVTESAVRFWLKGRYRPTPDKVATIRRMVSEHAAD